VVLVLEVTVMEPGVIVAEKSSIWHPSPTLFWVDSGHFWVHFPQFFDQKFQKLPHF
tara:strand:- start:388 stop:555 length:168 start_codon:yes stop_codon:yes gene_type:complete